MVLYDSEGRIWKLGKVREAAKRGITVLLLACAVESFSEAQEPPQAGASIVAPTGSATTPPDGGEDWWARIGAILATSIAAYSLYLSFKKDRSQQRIEVRRLLDEARDLIGGEPGTSLILGGRSRSPEEKRKLELAARKIGEAKLLRPADVEVLRMLGVCLVEQGKTTEGLEILLETVRRHPNNGKCWDTLGKTQARSGDLKTGRRSLEKVLQLDETSVSVQNNLGWLCLEEGDPEGAVRHFRKALDEDSGCFAARQNLGAALLRQEKFQEAIAELRVAGALEPTRAGPHINLASVYAKLNRLRETIEHLEIALTLNPHKSIAHRNYGAALVNAMKTGILDEDQIVFEKAQASFQTAVDLAPNDAEAHLALGKFLAMTGRNEAAAKELQLYAKLGGEDLEALEFLRQTEATSGAEEPRS